MRRWVVLLWAALAFGARAQEAPPDARDEDARRRFAAYAEGRWGPWDDDRQGPLELDMVDAGGGVVLAIVQHPTHRYLSYNEPKEVLGLWRGRVWPTRFLPTPRWARAAFTRLAYIDDDDGGRAFWNPRIGRHNGSVQLRMRVKERAIGDAANELVYRWTGAAWRAVELRGRYGGSAFVMPSWPHPIVAPRSRRCGPRLVPAGRDRFRLFAERPGGRRSWVFVDVPRPLADCRGTLDTQDCGGRRGFPDWSYSVVPAQGRWHVLEVEHHWGQDSGHRSRYLGPGIPIGCQLPRDE